MDYDGQLMLHLNVDDPEGFLHKAFFKIRLKSKVEKVVGNTVYFMTSLTYPDYIRIGELLKGKIETTNHNFFRSERLKEYIDARNLHIESRAKLGAQLKSDANALFSYYEEFRKVVDDGMSRKLREQQMKDAFFMYGMTKSGNFSVPGSGKTSSALAVYRFLKENDLIDRIVMIGPKNSFGSWVEEFNVCFDGVEELSVFSIQDLSLKTREKKKYTLDFETGNCNLLLFNYEALGSYLEEIKKLVSSRTLLVFDEVHKVKRIDGVYARYALDIASVASHIIAMTGTPIPNSYLDIYNFLHILFKDEYRDFFDFDLQDLREPSPSEIYSINRKIQPFFCRTTKKDLEVPDANVDKLIEIPVFEAEQKIFEILQKKYRDNKLALLIRILQLESDPNMLKKAIDIEEFKNILDVPDDIDFLDFVDMSDDMLKCIEKIEITSKRRACLTMINDLVNQGKSVIVWCIFRDSIVKLKQDLETQYGITSKVIYGEISLDERIRLMDAFKAGDYKVLITNPHTLAESVSLHSICHDAIYYEYSYNLVHLLQSKDRIHRLGLDAGQYTQYYYLLNWFKYDGKDYSLDKNIYDRLMHKESTMLDAIDNHILEPVYTTEEDLEFIFKDFK